MMVMMMLMIMAATGTVFSMLIGDDCQELSSLG
jgi:hypothetical protein